jgi:hypothetical protein
VFGEESLQQINSERVNIVKYSCLILLRQTVPGGAKVRSLTRQHAWQQGLQIRRSSILVAVISINSE